MTVFAVNAERDAGLEREFEVFHLPGMFLYHSGAFHCETHGEARAKKLRYAIVSALKIPAGEAP